MTKNTDSLYIGRPAGVPIGYANDADGSMTIPAANFSSNLPLTNALLELRRYTLRTVDTPGWRKVGIMTTVEHEVEVFFGQ